MKTSLKYSMSFFSSVFLVLLLVSGCALGSDTSKESPATDENGIITLSASSGIRLASGGLLDEYSSGYSNKRITPKINPDPNVVVHAVYEFNLDTDDTIEQILVVKRQGDTKDIIYIQIVDYLSDKQIWLMSWEGATLASDLSTFDLRLVDILGKHQPTISTHGLTSENHQTLSLFHPIQGLQSVTCTTLLSVEADSEVSIVSSARSIAYEESMVSGDPFPVLVMETDVSKPGASTLVRTIYQWNKDLGRYIVETTESIEAQELQSAQLKDLFKGRVADIESNLAGAWIRTEANEQQVVFFDSQTRSIRIIEGKLLESHEWISSVKTATPGKIVTYLANESFKSLKSIMSVTFRDQNNIYLTIQDRVSWDGTFTRLDGVGTVNIDRNANSRLEVYPFVLQGKYQGQNDSEIIFSGFGFTRRVGNTRESGSFVYYLRDEACLTLAFTDSSGVIVRSEDYVVKLQTNSSNQTQALSIDLYPARFYASSIEYQDDNYLRYNLVQ